MNNSYGYDADGNPTTRTINGVTVTLAYDAEGRLVSVTGPTIAATFTYDGDGKRVQPLRHSPEEHKGASQRAPSRRTL